MSGSTQGLTNHWHNEVSDEMNRFFVAEGPDVTMWTYERGCESTGLPMRAPCYQRITITGVFGQLRLGCPIIRTRPGALSISCFAVSFELLLSVEP